MGCKDSKQGGTDGENGPALPAFDIAGLDSPTKIEASMPFSKTKVEEFHSLVMKGLNGEDSLTLD